uniref:Uncharacterized protein n=1 Tax=Arundo donax TaxID=35708 RepID=A0A0A9FHC0_ARUDO
MIKLLDTSMALLMWPVAFGLLSIGNGQVRTFWLESWPSTSSS